MLFWASAKQLNVHAQEDDAEEDTWHANGLNDEEGEEDERDQDRLESHSKAGPHDRAPGTANAP